MYLDSYLAIISQPIWAHTVANTSNQTPPSSLHLCPCNTFPRPSIFTATSQTAVLNEPTLKKIKHILSSSVLTWKVPSLRQELSPGTHVSLQKREGTDNQRKAKPRSAVQASSDHKNQHWAAYWSPHSQRCYQRQNAKATHRTFPPLTGRKGR